MALRCLIVDDSPTFRGILRRILGRAPGLEVVGEAADGDEAVAQALQLSPDVITMDVRMPRRDGLSAIAALMQARPTPIVVVSAAAADGNEVSFQALKLGAVEVLAKPSAFDSAHFEQECEQIRQAVLAVAGLSLKAHRQQVPRARPRVTAPRALACIGIVASTGGPPALQKILSALPADYPVPLLVVQHIAPGFAAGMVRWLASQCSLKVRLAQAGEALQSGTVLFAPDGAHLMMSLGRVRLDGGPPIKSLKPSGTVLLTSLAREYGDAAAGVVLTGMGDDGAAGLKLMKEKGAFTAAQGMASSVVWGMPEVALRTGAAQLALELEEIPSVLLRLASLERTPAPVRSPLLGLEPLARTPTPRVPLQPGTRRKLLLVDDAETVLALEQSLFSHLYDLVLARDGEQALEAARLHRPDAMLLDHHMPKLTGAQVLERLHATGSLEALKVVVVSSETDPATVESWRRNGCQAILRKPIDQALLLSTVRQLVPDR